MSLTEGKNREVRNVLAYLGLQVSRLIRTAYGPFTVEGLGINDVGEVAGSDIWRLPPHLEVRIIAGKWRGRPLVAPKGDTTRPTADRTRETLFSMLVSRLGELRRPARRRPLCRQRRARPRGPVARRGVGDLRRDRPRRDPRDRGQPRRIRRARPGDHPRHLGGARCRASSRST